MFNNTDFLFSSNIRKKRQLELLATENWKTLSPNKLQPYNYYYQVPFELKSHISEITIKVLQGDESLMQDKILKVLKKAEDAICHENQAKLYERITYKPSIKPNHKNCYDDQHYEKPSLDVSLTHIPVYSHLKIHPTVVIKIPESVPKCFEINNLKNMFLEPNT